MRKQISFLLAVCLMTCMLGTAFTEGEPASRFYSREFTFYVVDEDPNFMQPTQLFFFDGVDDLPWLDIEEMGDLLSLFERMVYGKKDFRLTYEQDGAKYTLTRENGFYMVLDCEANTITFNDYNGFLKDPSPENSLLDQLSFSGFNASGDAELFQRDSLSSFDRYGELMVLDLGEYHIELIQEGTRGYIPLQTANDFLFSPAFRRSILYNGQAMILANDKDLSRNGELTPLGEIYYAAAPAERSQALADFGYNELSLMLDCLYGLKEQHNIRFFSTLFWQIGYDEPLDSANPGDADTAVRNFINYYLDDLHSAFRLPSWMAGYEQPSVELGPSSRLDVKQSGRYRELRSQGMGEDWQMYEEVGNTAYITFDGFLADRRNDYYEIGGRGEMAPDTIGLIIYAHQQIFRENSPIENVVIDLSNNEGGDLDAAVFVIAWLLGEGEMSLEDTWTGAQSTLVYRADVNLDRQFDERDTLGDKRVYCLISPVSFSCGNLVPSVCKYHRAVTLIGRATGGGACMVQPMSTAWGTGFQIPGSKRWSFGKNGSFYDIDEGVEPDIYMDHMETLYNREQLTELINSLR